MKNKQNLVIVICLIFVTFFILLLGLKKENNYLPQKTHFKIEDTLTLQSLYSDKKLFLNDLFLKDNFTLINIWASWCLPCKDEHPYLINLSKSFNLTIIGINYKDDNNNAKKFLLELGNPYREVLIDRDGVKSIELGAIGVPETYLVNKEKKIIKKFIGPLNQNNFNEILNIVKK
tara:strand:+ start:556 stop:1080 length:525 start_codon:yes stop_codon:yes gene_type:complete